MAKVTPKLANIVSEGDLVEWLGEVIQEKVGKENAGLVQIGVEPRGREHGPRLVLQRAGSQFQHTVEVKTQRQT